MPESVDTVFFNPDTVQPLPVGNSYGVGMAPLLECGRALLLMIGRVVGAGLAVSVAFRSFGSVGT